ncbi:17609_t:CDS:2 [Funneliformis caledonium]|uniref:17609_t:CDS:1 n=1 Tax=Funneliformis caledonium TaxID=1117310 RepID=A0A9N8VL10_9GLOM|nr:17609_t:CDS:2 [Funneliformis caledonium]
MIRQHNLSIDTEAAAKGQRVNNKSSTQKIRNNEVDSDDNSSVEGNDTYTNRIDLDEDEDISSSPSIPDEDINFNLVYALHTFQETVEGQASVDKGDSLTLLDDSNSYWWLVKVLKTAKVGYIPAENIETPYERLARLNKHRNVNLSSSLNNTEEDLNLVAQKKSQGKSVLFNSPIFVVAEEEEEYYDDEDFEDFEDGEYLEVEEEEQYDEINEPTTEQDEGDQVVKIDEHDEMEVSDNQDVVEGGENTSSNSIITQDISIATNTTGQIAEVRAQNGDNVESEPDVNQNELPIEQQVLNGSQKMNQSAGDDQSPDKQTGDGDGMIDINSSKEITKSTNTSGPGEISLDKQPDNVMINNNTSPKEASIQPSLEGIKPTAKLNIDGIKESSDTIKMTLTPQLGSDFIDFSDDDEAVRRPKQGGFFGRNESSDSIKVPTTLEEYNKSILAEVAEEKKKGKKDEKKKEKGFMNFFKRKKKNEPAKQMSSSSQNSPVTSSTAVRSNYVNQPIRPPQQQTDQSQIQPKVGFTANQQQRPQIQGQGMRMKIRPQPPPQTQNIQQQLYGLPNQMQQGQQQQFQQSGYHQGPEGPQRDPQKSKMQQGTGLIRPTQDRSQGQNRIVPSPIQVKEYTQSDSSVSTTPATPATPSNSMYNVLRIFVGQNIQSKVEFKIVLLNQTTTASDLIKQALSRFKLDSEDNWDDYFITIKEVDGDIIHLMPHDHPLGIFQSLNSSHLVPLPTIRRSSISSVSSNISTHTAIKGLGLHDDKNNVTFYLNKKAKRNSRSLSEKKLRVRVLIYADDLPAHLRAKGTVPRDSLSVPKHIADKAARRRSREEGKPKEKTVTVTGTAIISDVLEKAMEKFGILDGMVDDGEQISENDNGKPRYSLMVIVDGEEKLLKPNINIVSVYPSLPNFRHLSIDSLDSNSSLALDYRPDEPIFVLRLLRPEDRQQRSMPSVSEINRITQVQVKDPPPSIQSSNFNSEYLGVENSEVLSKKQLIEQQREYSRAKQKSIISANKNETGVDILTNIGSIRSSRIFGSKVRYSFIPADGEVIDISDIIEDIWGDDESLNVPVELELSKENLDPSSNELEGVAPLSINKKEQYRRSTTQDVDILEKMVEKVHNNDVRASQAMEDRIELVLNKVRTGQYGSDAIKNDKRITKKHLSGKTVADNKSIIQSNGSVDSDPDYADATSDKHGRKPSSASVLSATSESSSSTLIKPSLSVSSESDWILTDDFGLQELLILVRSGVNMLELKERRRSGWHLSDDPEKILEQIKPTEIRDEIKAVFASVNDELDKLEKELDQIMDDAIRVF